MAARAFLVALFAPEGLDKGWVAPEYGRYQLWDTIQQMTFFVNTVISQQAVMKFHGVGDPTKSPAQAAALEMSRNLLASFMSLFAATPGMSELYRHFPRIFRMSSECLNAAGHLLEILAALFSQTAALLYMGPIVCKMSATMSGAVRSVILQHFAKGGSLPPGREPDFGDMSLKESNQDKGGKIVGLSIGILLLSLIGMGDTGAEEEAALKRSIKVFLWLTVIHVLGNWQAVRQLAIPPRGSRTQSTARHAQVPAETSQAGSSESFFKRMLTPRGYPHTVVDSYTRYRSWCLLSALTSYPKQIVTSMLFWSNIYGVGQASRTPSQAVAVNIFMMGIDCIMGLLAGMPLVTEGLDYSRRVWFLRSAFLGVLAEFLMLASAVSPGLWFYVVVVIAKSFAAFGSTSGSRVNGAIAPALMKKECADCGDIELIHINVASSNQDNVITFPMGLVSVALLYAVVWTGWQPSFLSQFMWYMILQGISVVCWFGRYRNLPPLPNPQDAGVGLPATSAGEASSIEEPLLSPSSSVACSRSHSSEIAWEEENDRKAVLSNNFSGPASQIDFYRSLTP